MCVFNGTVSRLNKSHTDTSLGTHSLVQQAVYVTAITAITYPNSYVVDMFLVHNGFVLFRTEYLSHPKLSADD